MNHDVTVIINEDQPHTASCSCGEWVAEGWVETSVRDLAANHEDGTDGSR